MNFLPVRSDGSSLQCCGMPLGQPRASQSLPAGDLKLGVRPEFVERVAPHSPGALPMVLQQVQDVGTHFIWSAAIDGHIVKARLDAGAGNTALGDTVWFKVLGDKTCLYRNEEIVA
jgi:glycerol transport system ATP-binding protein